MHRGWIKLWRKTIESPVWAMDSLYLRVWIWLLNIVDHKTGSRVLTLDRIAEGVAYQKWGAERKPARNTILGILRWMEEEEMIIRENNKHFTKISIINWATYQPTKDEKITQLDHQLDHQLDQQEQEVDLKKLKELKPKTLSSATAPEVAKKEVDPDTNPKTFLDFVALKYSTVPLTPYGRYAKTIKDLLRDRLRSNQDPQGEVRENFLRFMSGEIDYKFFGKDSHDLATFLKCYPILIETGNGKPLVKANPTQCPTHGTSEADSWGGKKVWICTHREDVEDPCNWSYLTEEVYWGKVGAKK